jgi:hypothetical protein
LPAHCGSKEPAFIAALAFAGRIVAADLVWRAPHAWLIAFLLVAAGIIVFYRRAPSLGFALAVVLSFRSVLCIFRRRMRHRLRLPTFRPSPPEEYSRSHRSRQPRGIVRDSPCGDKQDTSALLGESHKRIEAIMTESTRALIY